MSKTSGIKTAILYVFHKVTPFVEYFIDYGIIDKEDYFYFFIYNYTEPLHETILAKLHRKNCSLTLRSNVGMDFGAWSQALFMTFNGAEVWKSFDYFMFVNSSVCGPFLPPYCQGVMDWVEAFRKMLNDDVWISGISINAAYKIGGNTVPGKYRAVIWPHVDPVENDPKYDEYKGIPPISIQSMVFCVSQHVLEFLIFKNIFLRDFPNKTKAELIDDHETKMSADILKEGKNLACLMRIYQGVDFRRYPNIPFCIGDPWQERGVLGTNLHPYETIFFKLKGLMNHDPMFVLMEKGPYRSLDWSVGKYPHKGNDPPSSIWAYGPANG